MENGKVEIALSKFRKPYNCAQTVYAAFKGGDAEGLEELSKCGGGKAPEGWRTGVYYHYYEYPSWHSVKRHYGIRTADYKLIHFYNDVDEWELYDLKHDPHEMRNVYDDPAYAGIRRQLHAELEALQAECGDADPCEREYEFFRGSDNL